MILKMANELNVNAAFIEKVSQRSLWYYRSFTIPKKSGGTRTINHPSPILKAFQYWLTKNFFVGFKTSKCATAYKIGCSIKDNAVRHLGNNHLLHLDIKDFFPSITSNLFGAILHSRKTEVNIDFDEKDIQIISGLCFLRNRLAIGSVCAPCISNIVMYEFDLTMERYAIEKGYTYSRYADDVILSSPNYIPGEIVGNLQEMLAKLSFKVNTTKTFFMGKGQRQVVTGIVINSQKTSIGRKRKHNIKSMLYKKLKNGEGNSAVILGHLNFLRDIDPQAFNQIILKYGQHFQVNIMNLLKHEV